MGMVEKGKNGKGKDKIGEERKNGIRK